MSAIDVSSVHKSFGGTDVLSGIDLSIAEGSITAILGRSGSGKTTLLRIIAGFERLERGSVRIDSKVVDDGVHFVHAQHRRIGYVPQDGALFPHLSAAANVAFGLKRKDNARALELLDTVGLSGLGDRRPHQLSGGQQQRVALARALAVRPKVVLLDEPFSSLDAALRVSVRRDVAEILAAAGTTTIIVTHDQDEALSMADHVAVLADGRVLARATPRELYLSPPNEGTAAHLGEVNVVTAEFVGRMATCFLGVVPLQAASATASGRLLLRAEQLDVHSTPADGRVEATVTQFDYYGHDTLARLRLMTPGAPQLVARLGPDRQFSVGERVWIAANGPALALPA